MEQNGNNVDIVADVDGALRVRTRSNASNVVNRGRPRSNACERVNENATLRFEKVQQIDRLFELYIGLLIQIIVSLL